MSESVIVYGAKKVRVVRDSVKIAAEGARQGNELYGWYESENLTIWVTEHELADDQFKDIVLHESIHHAIDESSLRCDGMSHEMEESVCVVMTHYIFELVRRNPDFIAWLQSESPEMVDQLTFNPPSYAIPPAPSRTGEK